MSKDYLSCLKSLSGKFAKQNNIFDIVVYGSYMRAKESPNDIDVVIIFTDSKLDYLLKSAHAFKELIKKIIPNPDVKAVNLSELFNPNFLAAQGIFAEGYSLLSSKPFCAKIGYKGYIIFTYSLKKLNHNKKTLFTYALIGRKKEGMTRIVSARPLGKGAVAVPIENSSIFEEFLKEWNVDYKKTKTLMAT